MKNRRFAWILAVTLLFTTACEASFDDASRGIDGNGVSEQTRPAGVERNAASSSSIGDSGDVRLLPAPQADLDLVPVDAWIPHGNTTIDGADIHVDRSGPWPDGSRTARAASEMVYTTRPGDRWLGSVRMAPGVDYRAELRFYDGQRIVSTIDDGPLIDSSAGASQVVATAPAGADRVRLRVFLDDVGYGEVHTVEAAHLVALPAGASPMTDWTPQGNTVVDESTLIVHRAGPYTDSSGTARAGTYPLTFAAPGQTFEGSVVLSAGVDFRAELRFFAGDEILETVGADGFTRSNGRRASLVEATAPAGTNGVALRVFLRDVEYGERYEIVAASLGSTNASPAVAVPVPSTSVPVAPTTTAAPATTTAPPATTTTAPPATTTTAPPATTTAPPTPTAPPTTTTAPPPPSDGDRQVIDASSWTGTIVLDQDNTIYDFGNVSAGRDITIAASNTEARNIRGTGARRIGQRDGRDYVDSGFRNFEFTYVQTQNGGGGELLRPYWIGGTDVNPVGRQVDTGSPVHIYAYHGDVIEPLIQDFVVRGWNKTGATSAHNDAIQFTGLGGGKVWNPTLRNVDVTSGAAHGVLMRHVWGVVTVEDSTFQRAYGAYFAFFGNAEDVSQTNTVLWRRNTLPDDQPGSHAAAFRNGWDVHGSSDMSLAGDGSVIQ